MLIVMWCWTMKTWLTNSRERLVCPICISICAHVRSKPLYDRLIAGSLYFPQLWFNLRAFPLFRRCLSWKVKRKKKRKNQGKNSLLARRAELWNWGGTHFWCPPSQSSMRLASHHFFSRGFFLDSRDSLHRKGSAQSLPLIGCSVFFGIGFSSLNWRALQETKAWRHQNPLFFFFIVKEVFLVLSHAKISSFIFFLLDRLVGIWSFLRQPWNRNDVRTLLLLPWRTVWMKCGSLNHHVC